jgi:tRNA (guanine-N7-)-methyltransferase
MAKNKLKKYAEIRTFANTFSDPAPFKGKWHELYFKNNNGITVELACGKGEYTVSLARKYPNRNFIGVDIKGVRLWRGAKTALEENLNNVAFLRIPIETIENVFAKNEVEEIWIPFPDPFSKRSKENRRLTSGKFIEVYRKILTNTGLIHFKTDDPDFFQFTLEVLKQEKCTIHKVIANLHDNNVKDDEIMLKTTYEEKHLSAGKKIHYLCFSLTGEALRGKTTPGTLSPIE